jgi:hypothetical protein
MEKKKEAEKALVKFTKECICMHSFSPLIEPRASANLNWDALEKRIKQREQ